MYFFMSSTVELVHTAARDLESKLRLLFLGVEAVSEHSDSRPDPN